MILVSHLHAEDRFEYKDTVYERVRLPVRHNSGSVPCMRVLDGRLVHFDWDTEVTQIITIKNRLEKIESMLLELLKKRE